MTQIKEHPEYLITETGDVYSTINNAQNVRTEPLLLKPTLGRDGYYWVGLKGSNKRMRKVHRLVAQAFVPNHENKPQVNHIDGNKTNNTVDNLEWVTAQENILHAHKTGLVVKKHGEACSQAKLKDTDTILLISLILDGYTNEELGEMFSLHSRYISLIRHKHRQKDIWEKHFPEESTVVSNKLAKQRDNSVVKDIVDTAFTTNLSNAEIAKKFDVDASTISRIRNNDKRVQKYFIPCMQIYLNNENL